MKDIKETLKIFTTFMIDQTNISKFSPKQKDTLTPPEPTTVVPTNRRPRGTLYQNWWHVDPQI